MMISLSPLWDGVGSLRCCPALVTVGDREKIYRTSKQLFLYRFARI